MTQQRRPQDHFERYFAEKIWEMMPAIYRHEDGLAINPNVLRALVEVLAKQAAILRRSQDHLWDDQSIELSNDWAVAYIADLVGTRLISALNKRGYRIDVAKTIYYRRRKGTPRILEELISDITGWEGKLVEQFKRLSRTWHSLDPKPLPYAGRFSGTMPGGLADLRHPRVSELANSAFDEFFHSPDTRRHRGQNGRYNIPKLAFHLYRLKVYKVADVTPFVGRDKFGFTFDPSGRDIPLFNLRNRDDKTDNKTYDWDDWHSALEWEVPTPIRCRLLAHAEYVFTSANLHNFQTENTPTSTIMDKLFILKGRHFEYESRLQTALIAEGLTLVSTLYASLLKHTLIDECGKKVLLTNALSVSVAANIEKIENITAAQIPDTWVLPPLSKKVAIDSEKGRFLFTNAVINKDISATYHYGFAGELGAGTYNRPCLPETEPHKIFKDGGEIKASDLFHGNTPKYINQINDNKTYSPIGNKTAIQKFVLQAANKTRPFIRLDADWILTGINKNAVLVLDGLWIGNEPNKPEKSIILKGDYESVTIRNCTIDPGGPLSMGNLKPVKILIEAEIQTLTISASIVANIMTKPGGLVEELIVCDAILQSLTRAVPVLSLDKGKMVHIERTTVLGSINVHRLEASEVILTGLSTVEDTQTGCFRFSAAPKASQLPRPYQSFLFEKDVNHWFNTRQFGQPDYGQLSETAPLEITRGAENSSEMGAFSSQLNPIKMDGLKTKIEEYMPFGLIPIFINTRIK